MPLAARSQQRDGAFGAAVDRDAAGAARSQARRAPHHRRAPPSKSRAVIQNEPDKLANGIAFGPRVIISEAALRATGLLVPGSLVRWSYRLRLPDGSDRAANAVIAAASAQLPDAGWQIRSRTNATPALERNVEHFTQFLTLVGLTALLVGGVGVANAVKSHIDRKRDVIATLKALGATGSRVFAIYLWQVLLLSAVGAAIGLALGAALPFAIAAAFGAIIPLPIAPALHPAELALAFGLRPADRARLRALAARPRPRRAGVGAVSRCGRRRSGAGRAGATSFAIGAGGRRARGRRRDAVL